MNVNECFQEAASKQLRELSQSGQDDEVRTAKVCGWRVHHLPAQIRLVILPGLWVHQNLSLGLTLALYEDVVIPMVPCLACPPTALLR